jgi:hypothetical protein
VLNRLGIVFLGLFLWQLTGFVLYFEHSYRLLKREIKQSVKEGIPQDQLITLKLSDEECKELLWLDRREFKYQGNLYDVVRKFNAVDNLLVIHCISDEKEKVLFATLGETVSKHLTGKDQKSSVGTWFKLLQLPMIEHTHSTFVNRTIDEDKTQKKFSVYRESFSSRSIEVDSPPPSVF